jgi:hypothetical protein
MATAKATRNQLLGDFKIAMLGRRLSSIGSLISLSPHHDLLNGCNKEKQPNNHDPDGKNILPAPSK